MNEKKRRFPIGRVIAIAIIVIVVAALVNPKLLFFLTADQQQVIADFQATYFTANNPVQNPEGSFDVLSLVSLALLVAECWAVNVVVRLFSTHFQFKSRHAETVKSLVCNLIKYAVVIYAILFGLSIMGVNTMAVVASLGVLGLVIGFGAQTLIEDVITGLFIIFEGQFHVGDIVTIDGFRGTVTAIGIRTTQITDAGGNIKIVNNSDIRTLTNLSEVESVAVADVGISYNADLKKAEEVLKDLVRRIPDLYPQVFHETPIYVGVQSLSASSVDLRVSAKVEEPNIYMARRILNRELKLAMDENNIEIPFPQVVVHQAQE